MSQASEPSLLKLEFRLAAMDDLPEILRQRRGMYEDMNYNDAGALAAMVSISAHYLAKALTDGSFRAWLALSEGEVAGGRAVIISPWPAQPYDLECRRATILNVYTDRDYRRRGIARLILETMIAWCKQEGFARVDLHASPSGRHLYESLGF